ncbi:Uncharacterised protein [Porphyromonas macacae]|uniref:Lipoprotein n=1 Tax=Porphyromonas macacae TaxID=28115 RepID=A0A379EAC8_9PORP|nr:type VI secretion system protein TssR domain-containing protein [Porphyromonas macacae]SUB89322.1 Uncharacterised protein [Porphyromonas macacae]
MKKNLIQKGLQISLCLIILSACAPVNRLTQVKKIPKEYTRNFCCGDIAIPRSIDKRGPWVVYSDRDNNTTFYNPGGKVPLKKVAYMDPFLVIGKKGDFLQLIKYNPEIIENGKLKNRKKAEYYGWMHRNNLVLSSRATTDVATGNAIKMITTLRDATPFNRPKDILTKDSLIVYSEPELLTPKGKIPFGQLIYLVKNNVDYTKSLIIGREILTPDSVHSVVSGWVSSSLVMPFGQTLYMDYTSLPLAEATTYTSQYRIAYPLSTSLYNRLLKLDANSTNWTAGLNAVRDISMGDSLSTIETTLPVPVIDNSQNLIYSLSGSPITYDRFQKIQEELKHINILFVFNGQKRVFANFKQIVAAIQPLKGILDLDSKSTYRLGAVMGFNRRGENVFNEISLNSDIDAVLKALESYADNKDEKQLGEVSNTWESLWYASRMLSPYKSENNIIILIGENGNAEKMDANLINTLAENNCRILGYQLYSEEDNIANNFVLQVEHLIDRSSEQISQKKRDILVHAEQVHPSNQYAEYADNIYRLDFPQTSMTQGWIVFPKKKEQLPQDLLLTVTDSLIREVEADNQSIVEHLEQAFREAGLGRSRLEPFWISLTNLPHDFKAPTKGLEAFASVNPVAPFPMTLKTTTADLAKGKYCLLLTESELNKLRNFMIDLTKKRVDYRYTPMQMKKGEGQACPDRMFDTRIPTDTLTKHEYLNTRKVRKSMMKAYLKWGRDEKVYPMSKKKIKGLSLSQAQQLVFYKPSFHPSMRQLLVKDLTNKKIFPDTELDKLLDYLLSKRKELEEAIAPENKFVVNGETYYKIEAEKLP